MIRYDPRRPVARASAGQKAGHTYVVHYDVCYGFCFSMPSYTTFARIEDDASGEVVSGTKP
jgi:hypothetical protein